MATDWSGHKTFLQDGHWLPIQYSIKEIHPQRVDNRIFMKESMWADVDEMDFKSGLEKFLKQKKNYREKAISQRKIILEKFSQEAIEKMYDDFMKEMI